MRIGRFFFSGIYRTHQEFTLGLRVSYSTHRHMEAPQIHALVIMPACLWWGVDIQIDLRRN